MTARLTIDLAALARNYHFLANIAPVGAVVKADAYGLGATEVVQRLVSEGCRTFFVATLDEAEAIAGSGEVYVFGGLSGAEPGHFRSIGARPILNDVEQVGRWLADGGGPAGLHVDTGMQRLGLPMSAIESLDPERWQPSLLMSHYACADQPEHPLNAEQRSRFARCCKRWPGVPTSLGNSAALLNQLERADWVGGLGRPGIALYGGNPRPERENPLEPVACLEGQVVQIRDVAAGEPVGYGATYRASQNMRVATLGIGYADGVPRLLSNRGSVMLAGRRAPIIGRVSMDAVQIDVTDLPVEVGVWAEVFGAQVAVDEVAMHAETISYEVLTGLGSRPRRSYSG